MKIGPNARCPCNSGKKYKHCHGSPLLEARQQHTSPQQIPPQKLPPDVVEALPQVREWLLKIQRREHFHKVEWPARYGKIRPPVSNRSLDGKRFVAVGGTIYQSGGDDSWIAFLYDFLQLTMGPEWSEQEARKPVEEAHILMRWFREVCAAELDEQGKFTRGNANNITPAISAFRSVAYDLFCVAQMQPGGVPPELAERLRHPDQFEGARYELWVAACFLRAGFTIVFEDERDRRRTHCEFVATFPQTGSKYSVEAKRRNRRNIDPVMAHKHRLYVKLGIQGLISSALSKSADHERLVFVDVNMPPQEGAIINAPWVAEFKASKEVLERQKLYRRPDAPSAFIFATNHPYHYLTNEKPDPRHHFFTTSFNQPELYKKPSLLGQRYPTVLHLMRSIAQHFDIPLDFPEQ